MKAPCWCLRFFLQGAHLMLNLYGADVIKLAYM